LAVIQEKADVPNAANVAGNKLHCHPACMICPIRVCKVFLVMHRVGLSGLVRVAKVESLPKGYGMELKMIPSQISLARWAE